MIDQAEFGRTGHRSSRVIFGAAGLGRVSQERADEVLPILLEFGVNHIDTAAVVRRLGAAPGARGWRATADEFFLATKTGDRDGAGARASLERSLTRLGVDHVDLIQLHNLVEPDEWEQAHGPGGAVEALARARDEGLTRFVGVTGHGLRIAGMHLRSLERFDFDSVLLPYNYTLLADAGYRADVEALLRALRRRDGWPSRPSSRWPGGGGGRTTKGRATAGTSRCRTATHSVGRSGSCSPTRSCFSTRRATCASSGPSWRLPRGRSGCRADEELQRDAEDLRMEPLFDGSELERI